MRSRFIHCIGILLALSGPACGGTTVPLVGTTRAPAAQGEVRGKADSNGNTRLTIEVQHLAPPEKVQPGATCYVVWVSNDVSIPQNLGALTLDSDLRGRLETTTPLHGFTVIITPEPSPTVVAPRGPVVLTAEVPPD